MKLNVITEDDELLKIASDWRRLFKESNCNNPFLSIDWVLKWREIFGSDLPLHLITFNENNRIVAIAPFAIYQEGRKRILRLVGYPRVTYMDFLMEETYRENCLSKLLNYLEEANSKWQIVDLQGLREESPNYTMLCKLLQQKKTPFFNTKAVSYYIPLTNSDFDTHFKNRSRIHNSVSNIKRNTKKIKLLGNLTYRELGREEFTEIFPLHAKRWTRKIDCMGFSDPECQQFFTQLAQSNQEDFKVHVTGLWLNQRLVAYEYGLRCNGHHVLYCLSHDDDFGVYGPGKMIIKEIIHSCFQEGLQLYDFGSGYERYKEEWTDQRTYINRIVFPTRDWKALLAYHKYRFIEITLHPLKHNPVLVRFKRDTLGKLRYLLLTYFPKILLPKYGWRGVVRKTFGWVKNWVYERQIYIVAKQDIQAYPCGCTDYLLREATIDDVSVLAQRMKLEPADLIRRFYKNDKFLMLSKDGQLYCGGWLSFSRLAIPRWEYALPLAKGDVVLYEYYAELGMTGATKSEFTIFLDCLLHHLQKQNYLQLYMGGSPSRQTTLSVPDITGYPVAHCIVRTSRFGGINYQVTPPLPGEDKSGNGAKS